MCKGVGVQVCEYECVSVLQGRKLFFIIISMVMYPMFRKEELGQIKEV